MSSQPLIIPQHTASFQMRNRKGNNENAYGRCKLNASTFVQHEQYHHQHRRSYNTSANYTTNNSTRSFSTTFNNNNGSTFGTTQPMLNALFTFFDKVFSLIPNWQNIYQHCTIGANNYNQLLSITTKQEIETFKKETQKLFDTTNKEHESLLFSLWKASFPEEEITAKNENWKKLGFQNIDPVSDFRGAGIFGLSNIIEFSNRYPTTFQRYLTSQHKPQSESYPFAIAGLNITMMLFGAMGWGFRAATKKSLTTQSGTNKLLNLVFVKSKSLDSSLMNINTTTNDSSVIVDMPVKTQPNFGDLIDFGNNNFFNAEIDVIDTKEEVDNCENVNTDITESIFSFNDEAKAARFAYEEIYCCAMNILDEIWYQSKASYFQFPQILDKTEKQLEIILAKCSNIEDIIKFNKTFENKL